MTTFPQDLRIQFDHDIHVIFGGSHSGKTTIVNCLKYGIFGLSSSNLPEGFEKRYFVSRIKEIDRKSLDINAVFSINQKNVTTNRKVFSSATTEINCIITDMSELFSSAPQSIEREKEYYEQLKNELLGNLSNEEKDFISELMFADENRKTILWEKNLYNFVYRLLSSSERRNALREVEKQLSETENSFNKLKQNLNLKQAKNTDNKRYLSYLEEQLSHLKDVNLDMLEEKLTVLKDDLNKCRKTVMETNGTIEKELVNRRNFSDQIRIMENKLSDLSKKFETLKGDYYGAFFKEATADVYHVGKYVYHKGQCPICFASISSEVKDNLNNKKCPLCGKNDLKNTDSMAEIEDTMAKVEKEIEDTEVLQKSNKEKLVLIQQQIDLLNTVLSEQHALEASILLELNSLQAKDEELHSKNMLKNQVLQHSQALTLEEQDILKCIKEVESANLQLQTLNELKNDRQLEIHSEATKLFSNIRQTFLLFVDLATNSELKADLSPELIPELNGRTLFNPDISQFERTILDYAFRVSLLSMLGKKTNTKPSLVLETPDEVADESYIPYIAKAIKAFSKDISIIITTYNSDLTTFLLNEYQTNERGRHFTDLIAKGNLTQRKYYQPNIVDFSGSI